jgi:hypothetical protein
MKTVTRPLIIRHRYTDNGQPVAVQFISIVDEHTAIDLSGIIRRFELVFDADLDEPLFARVELLADIDADLLAQLELATDAEATA